MYSTKDLLAACKKILADEDHAAWSPDEIADLAEARELINRAINGKIIAMMDILRTKRNAGG